MIVCGRQAVLNPRVALLSWQSDFIRNEVKILIPRFKLFTVRAISRG